MITNCRCCNAQIEAPVYRSGSRNSLTSLGEISSQETIVSFCGKCSHLQTKPIEDIEKYYDESYNILINSEEEDQLYFSKDGVKSFRVDHQVKVLKDNLDIPTGAKVLDFGSGKGATIKKLLGERPDITPHLFDVSDAYTKFWDQFCASENYNTYKLPEKWNSYFDIVVSFFALEHVENPQSFLKDIYGLLKEGGSIYGIVPNTYQNPGDFVVIDHVNHFSEYSLKYVLEAAGFTKVVVDTTSHYGALIFYAETTVQKPKKVNLPVKEDVVSCEGNANELSKFWKKSVNNIMKAEQKFLGKKFAIYGSGFYGSFIASAIENTKDLVCFLDQNKYRQGLKLFDKEIIAPANLPEDVEVLFVGLNPNTSRLAIDEVANHWRDDIEVIFVYGAE